MHDRRRGARAALMMTLVVTTGLGAWSLPPRIGIQPASGRPAPPAARTARPNILLITTDDQNRGDLRWMPRTRALLGGHGVTFTRALSPDPLCCPARAELLTGQLGQNNGVRANEGARGGFHALRSKQNTLAVWLQRAGYRTALVGKYLNGYDGTQGRQRGWTVWNPSVRGIYSYIDTTFLGDGSPRHFRKNVSSVIGDYTVSYIRRFAAGDKPFFIWASHLAPHARVVAGGRFVPPLPTRRHRDDLRGVRAPSLSKPSFNNPGGPRVPYPGQTGPKVSAARVQAVFTRRIQSLLDVDDAVARAVAALRDTGELRRTYIFLVSDNGLLLGEHRLNGKDVLYREALEVPLLVRIPGSSGGHPSPLPVTIADLAPTIASLAGATPGRRQDGRSFAPVLRGGKVPWRDTQLIQAGGPLGGWWFRGVSTPRFSYLHRVRDGASFVYDHLSDPFELHDVSRLPRYRRTVRELRRRASLLGHCAGRACNRRFGPVPAPRR